MSLEGRQVKCRRTFVRLSKCVLITLGLSVAFGCSEESTSGEEELRDRGILIDANIDAFIIDARTQTEADIGTDAGTEVDVCFRDGATLQVLSSLGVLEGAQALLTRFDLDGDGVPELIVRSQDDDLHTFTVYSGLPLSEIGSFTVSGATMPEFMTTSRLDMALARPITYGARTAVYTIQKSAEETVIQFVDSDNFSQITRLVIPRAASSVHVIARQGAPMIMANLVDGGCMLHAADADQPALDRGRCTYVPGRDVNGDMIGDAVRLGPGGLALTDLILTEDIELQADHNADAIGYEAQRLVSATADGQTLRINYHDPIGLNLIAEEQTNIASGSVFGRLEFVESEGRLRLIAQYSKLSQQFIRVFETGEDLRMVAQYGPYIHLSWSMNADADGDGEKDLLIVGGSRDDGFNVKLDYRRMSDGREAHLVAARRGFRYTPIWTSTDPAVPTDIDGCPGIDYALLSETMATDDGIKNSRILFRDEEGDEPARTEASEVRTHEAGLVFLDEREHPYLVELKDDSGTSPTLTVYGPANLILEPEDAMP